jgi:hypothetical protein
LQLRLRLPRAADALPQPLLTLTAAADAAALSCAAAALPLPHDLATIEAAEGSSRDAAAAVHS